MFKWMSVSGISLVTVNGVRDGEVTARQCNERWGGVLIR